MKIKHVVVVLFLACAVVARADVAFYPVSDDEEYLLELLATGDERDRRDALRDLGSAATERSVPDLIEVVETADLREASTAVEILGRLGVSQAVPVIIKRLEDTLEAYTPLPPTPDVSGLSDTEAWEVLRKDDEAHELYYSQGQFIMQGCIALGRISPEDALTVLPGIIDTEDKDTFKHAAFLGLGFTEDDRALPIIIDILASCDQYYEVRGVVEALFLLESKAAVDALCDLLTDPLTPNRRGVISEIGQVIQEPRIYYGTGKVLDEGKVQQLVDTIWGIGRGDPDPEYRMFALMTIAVFFTDRDEDMEGLLDMMESDIDTYTISLKSESDKLVFSLFRSRYPDLTGRMIANTLGSTRDKEETVNLLYVLEYLIPRYDPRTPPANLWGILIGMTENSEAEIRGVCLRPLASLSSIDSVPYVLDAFDDPSPGVRWEAADVYTTYELVGADWEMASAHLPGNRWESAYDFILDAAEREESRPVYEVMIKALVSTGDPRAVEVLSDIFEDAAHDDENTRLAMIQMLYGMNTPKADAAIARLAETEEEKRYVGLRETFPRDVYDPEVLLSEYIENPDSRYRGRASQRYADMMGPEAIDTILDYLPDEDDPEQRIQAYNGLEDLNSPIPVERLLPLFENEDSPRVLMYILPFLPVEDDEQAAAVLARRIETELAARVDGSHAMFLPENTTSSSSSDYNDFNRCYDALMRKLTAVAPSTAHPILLDIYRNDPVEESRATAYGLALTTGQPDVVELIREGLESPEAGVRYHAVKAAPEHLGDEGVDIVAAAVSDPGFEVKRAAIELIADLLGPAAADILAPALESPSVYIREAAGKHLADWGDPRAFDYYYNLWDGRIVRKETYSVIKNLAKYDDPRGWEVIREVSEIGGRSNTVRDAWLLRAEHGDPDARELFLSMIDEEEPLFTGTDIPFEGLRWFSDNEVRAVIERIAADETEYWLRRDLAWEVLAFWKDPRALDYLMERFSNEENPRREYMLTALSNFDDPVVWEIIRDAAENDTDRLVRKEAQRLLEKRDDE